MSSTIASTTSNDTPHRPARDLIAAVVQNMRRNLEPLRYSTLVPSRYLVYVHPAEYARLESILPILQEQTIRALTDELDALNRRTAMQRILRRPGVPVEMAARDWHVEFLPDPDGDVGEGAILIDSELRLPSNPELALGVRTRRITTVHRGEHVTTRQHTSGPASTESSATCPARLTFDDETGPHVFEVVKESVTIGRGGITYPVDVRIVSSADVSREHARIRRDSQSGRFFLIDLSSLGTTLNGRHVPRGHDEVNGAKRENGLETPLPHGARIGLAETVFLKFELGSRSG